ncbi:MAG TPA: hypothetical protein VNW29_05735 [Candidatus Sulfotelmatobacter sp.]|nr:hypothetical protein [Candidatus Sulfotelmatobacter sp.]
MNKGKKLDLALQKTATAVEAINDIRILRARMSPRQIAIYNYMVKGYNELETLVLAKRVYELVGVVPVVRTDAGTVIKTNSLKSVKDLDKLSFDSYQALHKIAKDHIAQAVGSGSYGSVQESLILFFQMIAPQAASTLYEIMQDKKISPQTRVMAANSILDRSGRSTRQGNVNETLPVTVSLQLSDKSTPQPDLSTIFSNN